MSSNAVSEQCVLIHQAQTSLTNEQLKTFFQTLTDEFNGNYDGLKEIITALNVVNKRQLCRQSCLSHSIFVVLRDCLINLLSTKANLELLLSISVLFKDISWNGIINDELVELFLDDRLINELITFFNTKIFQQFSEVYLIETIDHLLFIYHRILLNRLALQSNSSFERLFNALGRCLTSQLAFKLLRNLKEDNPAQLNAIEKLLFVTCVEYIYWEPYENNQWYRQILFSICKTLLNTTVQIMQTSPALVLPLARLFSLHVMITGDTIDRTKLHSDYYQLIQYYTLILANDARDTRNDGIILKNLYYLTFDINFVSYMKTSLHLTSLLSKMVEIGDYEISFSVYRLLVAIMTEEDIKTLANSKQIAEVFFIYLISVMDVPSQKVAFENLFHSLKSLIQHDEIKIEFTELNIIPILIRCVMEEQFDLLKIRRTALEILLALSFYDKAFSIIKNEKNFLDALKILLSSSERTVRHVTERMIWKLEGQIKPPSDHQKSDFDIMLSYSHSDKKLCYHLYEQLTKDGYRVWLDREQMHGSTIAVMAEAIEHSEFVLICMSDAYKQSPNCQIEATYAFERNCQLIPLVVKPNYRPDGWLGILVSGKLRIDFPKLQFEAAYSQLKHELEGKSKEKKVTMLPIPEKEIVILDLPHCVNSWSPDHVRSFLLINNLPELLPVFTDFDGPLLFESYSMFQASREKMFELLRSEVASSIDCQQLKLGTYLRFLRELKKYIPINKDDQRIICNLM